MGEQKSRAKLIASGLIPFSFLVVMLVFILSSGSSLINLGIPLPELTIEKINFVKSEILVTVRNTGPIPVDVAVADVNDRIQPAAIEPDKHLERFETAVVKIPFSWNKGEPYKIGLTTQEGIRFEKSVDAAALALEPNSDTMGLLLLIGTYVGVIPILIGLMWLPFIKKISNQKYIFFLALTVGLLLFLGIDAIVEALEVSSENLAGVFHGPLLIATVVLISLFGLYYAGEKLTKKSSLTKLANPYSVALMVSIGIGLHNLGEGLAIGAAIGLGQVALSTFLIIGFALHNTTEGIAIAAPVAKEKTFIRKIIGLGLIAGVPAIFGTWVGGFAYSPFTSIVFLAIGAGAIFQVVIVISKWLREYDRSFTSTPVVAGIAIGMLIMYLTGMLV
ncbi:MAG: divalent cation transporter [Candidatus Nitrosotenuis sp.]|nr:MAG: divalent cation transporter [Candidatus Nitrosotenuis sp.]